MQPGRPAVRVAQRLGDPAPESSGRTEFRNRHELVVVGDQTEADLRERIRQGDPGCGQQSQVVGPRRDHTGQFPARVRTAVVKSRAVHGDRPYPRIDHRATCHRDDVVDGRRRPAAEIGGERIGTEIDRHRGALGVVSSGNQCQHRLCGRTEFRTGVDQDRRQLQVDALQPAAEIAHRDAVGADPQHQCAHPLDERVQHQGIAVGRGAGEAGCGVLLGDLPSGQDVAARVRTADEGPLAGQRRLRTFIQRGVERVDREAFVGRRVQKPLRLIRRFGGAAPAAFSEHVGDGGAPAGPGRLEGFVLDWGHRQLLIVIARLSPPAP